MQVVFTYLPFRLKDITEIYLKYSIGNLNNQNITPTIFSDKDYFFDTNLKYKWIEFDVDSKYKVDTLWSYPKLKVLSIIDKPFIHLDNDLIVKDYGELLKLIDNKKLNICYKRKINIDQKNDFINIFKKYTNKSISFSELNNTCIIGGFDYLNINKSYSEVLNIIDDNYDFFCKRYNGIPPITLNQQYVNLYFNEINYLFDSNPSQDDIEKNGLCHIAEKSLPSWLFKNKNLL